MSPELPEAPGPPPGQTPAELPADLHRRLGLTDAELADIVALLGRPPTELELAIYAVMWSEHCSYKSSKRHLGRFPTEAPWVLVGPGEGAGVLNVGDGLAVTVRIESHNHPSAVEPYRARRRASAGSSATCSRWEPVPLLAVMDPLRFGPLDDARPRICSRASCRESADTGMRSASRPSAARSCSTTATTTTRS